jgi:uncharacterized OsmC-like protein
MDEIREAIERATKYLAGHPEEAVYTDSRATAVLETGLRVRVSGPGDESAVTDMVPAVGGGGSAPSPGWLLRAAVASCVVTLAAMRTAQLGYSLGSLEVEVDSVSDDRGILGIDDAIPAGPLSVRIAVRLSASGVGRAEIESTLGWAVDHCPVVEGLRRAVPVSVEIGWIADD